MSDILRPIPFSQLMTWALTEYKNSGSIFGVSKLLRHTDGKSMPIFDERIEAPFGPASGPNTQRAQNIIAAYAAGSRFFELSTVGTSEGVHPAAQDMQETFNEHVKAWFACKLLAKELALGDPDAFVFHMSVGYDWEGIRSEPVDMYLDRMKNASETPVWQECMDWASSNLNQFERIDAAYLNTISPAVSRSVTVCSLRACPPAEIERAATHLILEKGLHTYIKCNPTLLGYEFSRKALNGLGYDNIQFDDLHFKGDFNKENAFPMFRRLMRLAGSHGVTFGVKLTNTFPVDVATSDVPSEETFLSGKPMYPLSLALTAQIAAEFQGWLRFSYSGGADVFSVRALYEAGVWPVTMTNNISKPGGYERFFQIGQTLLGCSGGWKGVNVEAVERMAKESLTGQEFSKPIKPAPLKKLSAKLPLLDCFTAPCRGGCPIQQDIPAAIALSSEGKYAEALEVITWRNPLPFITGTICPHHCMDKCMRDDYEEAVRIREWTRKAAEEGFSALLPKLKPGTPITGKRVAIVGGGPAGLSAAYFLGRAGVDVTLFEQRESVGGIVRHVIPAFRISGQVVDNDVALCKAMGAKFVLNTTVKNAKDLLDAGYTDVILAIGAWQKGDAGLQYGQAMNVISFLEQAKRDPTKLDLGEHVAVIGSGNTAMDAARAAIRLPGVKDVKLIYRRIKRYMPAGEEELKMTLADGVEFMELLAPVGCSGGELTCERMRLGAPDSSGRRRPVKTGESVRVPASTVIVAVGEKIDGTLYQASGLELDDEGKPKVNPITLESSVPHVYAIGDGQTGPSTVAEAIAGAVKAAQAIVEIDMEAYQSKNRQQEKYQEYLSKRGEICTDCAHCEDSRCLGCATVCETCVSVCPNRANVAIWVPGMEARQIVHVDGMCNACGNCAAFCPYDSQPWEDKFTLFWSLPDFKDSKNAGFLCLEGTKTLVRLDGEEKEYDVVDPGCGLREGLRQLICSVYSNYRYLLGRP